MTVPDRRTNPDRRKNGRPSWTWRRAIIFPVVIFACYELDMMRNAPDTRVSETIAYVWGVLVMVLICTYTGLATVQDIAAIWRLKSGRPYEPEQQPDPPQYMPEQRPSPENPQ